MIVVGRITKAHGIKGEVIVDVSSDDPARFDPGSVLKMGTDPSSVREVIIDSVRHHQGRLLVALEGVADRSAADQLRGNLLFILQSQMGEPEEGGWWQADLAGAAVVDVHGRHLGTLTEVLGTGMQDLWKVSTPQGDVLVPAVAAIVKSVDVSSGRVVIDPPAGLFEDTA